MKVGGGDVGGGRYRHFPRDGIMCVCGVAKRECGTGALSATPPRQISNKSTGVAPASSKSQTRPVYLEARHPRGGHHAEEKVREKTSALVAQHVIM